MIDLSQKIDDTLDVLVENGLVREIGKGAGCTGRNRNHRRCRHVCGTGLIDMHVHLRDPGLEYKEDIISGTKARLRADLLDLLHAQHQAGHRQQNGCRYIINKPGRKVSATFFRRLHHLRAFSVCRRWAS